MVFFLKKTKGKKARKKHFHLRLTESTCSTFPVNLLQRLLRPGKDDKSDSLLPSNIRLLQVAFFSRVVTHPSYLGMQSVYPKQTLWFSIYTHTHMHTHPPSTCILAYLLLKILLLTATTKLKSRKGVETYAVCRVHKFCSSRTSVKNTINLYQRFLPWRNTGHFFLSWS